MKKYTSCFIGIPLPKKYQQKFETLLKDVSDICPLLETSDPETPHITGYYLDEQSQFNIPAITKSVELTAGLLKDTELTVSNLDYFSKNNPKVLFINVLYPKDLKNFNQSVTKSLAKYYANDNDQPFHPHLTIARMNTPEAKKSFKESIPKLKTRLSKVVWKFPITELVLYGVDSTKYPQYQEKLISISIR